MFAFIRNPLVWLSIAILGLVWYQSSKIDRLTTHTTTQADYIERLEVSIGTANSNIESLNNRIDTQFELMEQSVQQNRKLNDEYKDYIDTKFTSTGGMLINIQRQVRDLSSTGDDASTATGGASPVYIELPPEVAGDILRLLRDADEDRLESDRWKLWYCKHNPSYPSCKEWYP